MILTTVFAAALTVAAQAQGAPATDTPILGVAQASPDCGNLHNLAGRAFCVTAPIAVVGTLADEYIRHFEAQGWLPADGDDNRVILVKRREGGGCDGLQMVAFYDTAQPATPEAPGYLGFATVPGDVCAAQPAAAEPAPAQ
ncbi:hypothetical protein E4M02_12125 [Brevundimonas sp. S30B]|uniref:hypothetical protein n=1 Tax=unclassified Brevundimonas TaxID=2622653 RepID=UPI0010720412|nr:MULTISPECIES: hypothetical protein [unclassified Brevundimonas]QBX36309.1 hypothetical protein E4M01_00185 [Brevundimonas sp. MF30-B]TFW01018.1 hypothetical protein E4M02_12125 [Brevundimonas sp. S30B]